MIEIKYRGKSITSEEWFEGDLVRVNDNGKNRYFIISDEYETIGSITGHSFNVELGTCQSPEVVPETIGQWTGLYDKNRVKIYKGDLVKFYEAGKMWKAVIGFNNGAFTVDFGGTFLYLCNFSMEHNLFEVIRNIYDNPELLEEGK